MKSCHHFITSLRGLTMSLRGGFSSRRGNLHINLGLLTCTAPNAVRRMCRALCALATTLLMTSCSALDLILATPLPVVQTKPPLPSPTFAWFPPSATPSPQVFTTRAATPEMRPGLGDVFLTEDISDPSLWDTATSDQGGAEIDEDRLTLAVQSGVYMISLRHELIVNDFYAEITASPGLCRADDSYGFLVRANVAYYRFSLTCNGMVSAERVSVGTRQVLQVPLPSGDVPPGAPGEVRIGVWAVGTEMRLFLNGRYQFSVNDSNYASGTLGVFVNSAGATAAVVSFSDLSVQSVTYNPPISTPQP
jgi:hypothetical protein